MSISDIRSQYAKDNPAEFDLHEAKTNNSVLIFVTPKAADATS